MAAALTATGWNPAQIGTLLTFGGVLGIAVQAPAGAVVDTTRRKRALIAMGVFAVVAASLLLAFSQDWWSVALAQTILAAAGPFIAPAVMAITLGLVGKSLFDTRLGRNRSFDAAGNVCAALLMGWIGWRFGTDYIFLWFHCFLYRHLWRFLLFLQLTSITGEHAAPAIRRTLAISRG